MIPDRPRLLAPTRAGPWVLALAALGLPICILLALLVPFGEVVDESAHLLRVVALTDGQVIGHRETLPFSDGSTRTVTGVTVDPAWERLSRSRPIATRDVPGPTSLDGNAAGKAAFFPLYTIGTYFPVFYLPSAAGLWLGEALGLPHTTAAHLGRFANLVAYLVIGLAALAIAERGRVLLFCILILPMSLSLAASFNHDSLIIATTVLAAALLSRGSRDAAGPSPRCLSRFRKSAPRSFGENLRHARDLERFPTKWVPVRRQEARQNKSLEPGADPTRSGTALSGRSVGLPTRVYLGLAASLIALVLLAKPPYAPLAAMLLVPLPARPRIGRFLLKRTALVALVVLPGFLWFGYVSAFVSTPVPRYTYEAGPLWIGSRPTTFDGTDPQAQAQVLLSKPVRLLTVPARFLFTFKHIVVLAQGIIGSFGWLDRPLPVALYWLWTAALIAPLVALAGQEEAVRRMDVGLLAGSALLCLWLVILSQYLSWTNVGELTVYGPQGRYLLPILPLLALAAPRLRVASLAGWRRIAVMAPIAAAAVSVVVVPIAAAQMY